MKAKSKIAAASVAAMAIGVAVFAAPKTYAEWIVPVSVQVGFTQTDSRGGATITFDANSTHQGYSSLTLPAASLSAEQLAEYSLPVEDMSVFDNDCSMPYFFAGWSLSPDSTNVIASAQSLTGEVTLYAVWTQKAYITITLTDNSYSLYDISFTLTLEGEEAISLQTSASNSLTANFYLSSKNTWEMNFASSTRTSTISSQTTTLKDGSNYSATATVVRVPSLPTSLEEV